MSDVVRFVDLLVARAEAIGERRNAPHTRLRIQIATAHLLQESGYEKLSIGAICEQVNLTPPGFYRHYRNKQEVAIDLLKELAKTEAQMVPSLIGCEDLGKATNELCNWYLRFHIGSGALFATMTEMRRSVPEVYELWNARSRNLLDSVSYQLDRFERFGNIDSEWSTFVIETIARAINVTADRMSSHPGPVTRLYADDVNRLVRMFSRMMYQSLTGERAATIQEPGMVRTRNRRHGALPDLVS